MKKITILGSSGSIGQQSMEVIASKPDEMQLFGLAVKSNTELLIRQAHQFHPTFVASEQPFDPSRLPAGTGALIGENAAAELAALPDADVVINGISGFSALLPLLSALKAGKRVALANKESIVCGNQLVDEYLSRYGGELLPVDSEQSAIFQCLQNGRGEEVSKLILTASGGPFWQHELRLLEAITVQQALRHPTWRMGKKITIDSATLFNKGLEIMEAAYLFHKTGEEIDVLIHPQSIVHSMVAYRDGTTMANMSLPDMRLPIQYALTYPDRSSSICRPLNLAEISELTFHRVDEVRFPAIRMAYDALKTGGTMTTAYNGANEAAVQAFCEGKIGFLDIGRTVDYTLQRYSTSRPSSFEDILAADLQSRSLARQYIEHVSGGKKVFS
jgi:1-deoxy-D-xylulose-5-phosphate reductoisomerase